MVKRHCYASALCRWLSVVPLLVIRGYLLVISGYHWLSVVIVGYRCLSAVDLVGYRQGYRWLSLLLSVGYQWLPIVGISGYRCKLSAVNHWLSLVTPQLVISWLSLVRNLVMMVI